MLEPGWMSDSTVAHCSLATVKGMRIAASPRHEHKNAAGKAAHGELGIA
jgi:hypothetical protein